MIMTNDCSSFDNNDDETKAIWYRCALDGSFKIGRLSKAGFVLDENGRELCAAGQSIFPFDSDNHVAVPDLVRLSYYNEPEVLKALQVRFERKMIYTWCGILLIAINPYDYSVGLYGDEHIDLYRSFTDSCCLDPHIFSVAQQAFQSAIDFGTDHSIVISGESGAGKTVSMKHVLKFVNRSIEPVNNVRFDQKLDAANCVLEAYGNARTCRNANSSRFGKYIEIKLGRKGISEIRFDTFLLEKTRVSKRNDQESNFHVFYAFHDRRTSYVNDFDDRVKGDYLIGKDALKSAFMTLEISDTMIRELFAVTDSILLIGNIRWKDDLDSLDKIVNLLGLDSRDNLLKALAKREIRAGKDFVVKDRTLVEIISQRDALAQLIYIGLFKRIVGLINKSMETKSECLSSLGILDIFGFENFETNGFEQLCINYANEKLQHVFYESVFKRDQTEFCSEGLNHELVIYNDNSNCVGALNAPDGLFNILNDHIALPKLSTQQLLDAIFTNDRFVRQYGSSVTKRNGSGKEFLVRHYNGLVVYDLSQFLNRNECSLSPQIASIFLSSKSDFVRSLFSQNSTPRQFKQSMLQHFRKSLNKLLNKLSLVTPHYVRCMKPNDSASPFKFDQTKVLDQILACGIIQTLKICAVNYPLKFSYEEFVGRYALVVKSRSAIIADHNYRQITQRIISAVQINECDYRLGKTKIFLKQTMKMSLEKRRRLVREKAACSIQALYRGYKERRQIQNLKETCLRISNILRNKPKNPEVYKEPLISWSVDKIWIKKTAIFKFNNIHIMIGNCMIFNLNLDRCPSLASTTTPEKCRYSIECSLETKDKIIDVLIKRFNRSAIKSSMNPIAFPAYGIFMCLRFADKSDNGALFSAMARDSLVALSRTIDRSASDLLQIAYWLNITFHLYHLCEGKGILKERSVLIRRFNLDNILPKLQQISRSYMNALEMRIVGFLEQKIIPNLIKQSRRVPNAPRPIFHAALYKLINTVQYFQQTLHLPDSTIEHLTQLMLSTINNTGFHLISNCEKWRETNAAMICRTNVINVMESVIRNSFISSEKAGKAVSPIIDACNFLTNLDRVLKKPGSQIAKETSLSPSSLIRLLLKSKKPFIWRKEERVLEICRELSKNETTKKCTSGVSATRKNANHSIPDDVVLTPIDMVNIPDEISYMLRVV